MAGSGGVVELVANDGLTFTAAHVLTTAGAVGSGGSAGEIDVFGGKYTTSQYPLP